MHGSYRDPHFLATGFDWSAYTLAGAESLGSPEAGHVTDPLTDRALRRLRDRPFALLLHQKAPHDDFEYQPRYEHLFDGAEIPAPDSLREDQEHRSPASRYCGSSVSQRNPVRTAVHRMSQWDYPTGRLDARALAPADRARAAYQKYLRGEPGYERVTARQAELRRRYGDDDRDFPGVAARTAAG